MPAKPLKRISTKLKQLLPNNRFARSVSVLAGGTAAGQLIVIAASPILTRLYTPEDFGLLAVYAGILGILGVIANLRYQLAIPLPDSDEDAASIAALSLLVVVLITVLAAIAVWLFGAELVHLLNTPALETYLWLVPVGIFLVGIYQTLQYWALRTKLFSIIAKTKMVQSASVAGIQIIGAALGPVALLGGRTLGQAAVNLSLWKGIKSTLPAQGGSVNVKSILAMALKFKQFPLFSSWAGLLNASGSQVPPLFFAALFGPAAAGGYMLAQRVINMPLSVIGAAIADAFLPSSIDALREKRLGRHVASLFLALASLILPGATLLFFIAPGIFGVVFGEEWYLAGEIVRWLSPMLAIQFLISPVSRIFVTLERQGLALSLQASLFALRIGALLLAFLVDLSLLDAVKIFSLASALGYGLYFLVISKVAELDKQLFLRNIGPTMFASILILLVCLGSRWLIKDEQLWLFVSFILGGLIVAGRLLILLKGLRISAPKNNK